VKNKEKEGMNARRRFLAASIAAATIPTSLRLRVDRVID
jgi:hypothetical protein